MTRKILQFVTGSVRLMFQGGWTYHLWMTALTVLSSGQAPLAAGTYTSPFAAVAINAGYDPAQGYIPASQADPAVPAYR